MQAQGTRVVAAIIEIEDPREIPILISMLVWRIRIAHTVGIRPPAQAHIKLREGAAGAGREGGAGEVGDESVVYDRIERTHHFRFIHQVVRTGLPPAHVAHVRARLSARVLANHQCGRCDGVERRRVVPPAYANRGSVETACRHRRCQLQRWRHRLQRWRRRHVQQCWPSSATRRRRTIQVHLEPMRRRSRAVQSR